MSSKAAATRFTILEKAFEIIYTKGYQTTSVDEIIAATKVTKGAFYYHFKTKDEMGLAIINEIVKPTMMNSLVAPLEDATDPLTQIYEMTKALLFDIPFLTIESGCPVGNLAHEMTPWNMAFGTALSEIITTWKGTIEQSLKKGKKKGVVGKDVNEEQVAYFVMSGYWGIRDFGKLYNSSECYHSFLNELKLYLESKR